VTARGSRGAAYLRVREIVHGEIRYDVSGEFVKTVWLCC